MRSLRVKCCKCSLKELDDEEQGSGIGDQGSEDKGRRAEERGPRLNSATQFNWASRVQKDHRKMSVYRPLRSRRKEHRGIRFFHLPLIPVKYALHLTGQGRRQTKINLPPANLMRLYR